MQGGYSHENDLRVTVAICTRDRERQLARALRSLGPVMKEGHEVIIVDNASVSGRTRELVENVFPQARYVREPREGLDFARNRAVQETETEIIAFLDDDAVAEHNWLAALVDAFRCDHLLALCFGRVEALNEDTSGARLFEANGGFGRGDQPIELPGDKPVIFGIIPVPLIANIVKVGSGCSMAVRRSALATIGGFDNALDLGNSLAGGGDLDIIWRFLYTDFHVRYEPASRARHEHRADPVAATRQIIEHNRSLIATLTKALRHLPSRNKPAVLVFLAWRLLKPSIRIMTRIAGRDPLAVRTLLLLWWGCWRGLVAYPAAQGISRSRDQASSQESRNPGTDQLDTRFLPK